MSLGVTEYIRGLPQQYPEMQKAVGQQAQLATYTHTGASSLLQLLVR